MTSRVPAWTTRLRIGSLPLTPILTMHWNAKEKQYVACLSNVGEFKAGESLGGLAALGGMRP